QDDAAFAKAVAAAADIARQGRHATFGIQPDYPETGYGYIEADTEQPFGAGYLVRQFVEKPDEATATGYLQAGNYYWNSGMFCFHVGTLLQEMDEFAPKVIRNTGSALQAASHSTSTTGGQVVRLPVNQFSLVPDISIDYALMEKSTRTAVVPCHIGWSDIRAWPALSGLVPADEQGNRSFGEVIAIDSRSNYVHSPRRLAAVLGVADLIVVDTADALLVAHRDKAQDVKNIVTELKKQNHEAHLLHQKVYRPWGS